MADTKDYGSLIRNNLMYQKDYAPYCGNAYPVCHNPRAHWDEEEKSHKCTTCGWKPTFDQAFYQEYKAKWHPHSFPLNQDKSCHNFTFFKPGKYYITGPLSLLVDKEWIKYKTGVTVTTTTENEQVLVMLVNKN